MGLDILAINKDEMQKAKNNFFKKYELPDSVDKADDQAVFNWLDKVAFEDGKTEEMLAWQKRMAKKLNVTVNKDEQDLYTSSEDKVSDMAYEAYEDLEDDSAVDSCRVGYGFFYWFRQELAPYCGAKYYYAKKDEWGHPDPNSYMFENPDIWETNDVGKSLFNFFMHSDCDGILSAHDVHNLKTYLKYFHIYDKMKQKSTAPRKDEFLNFISWIENQEDNVYWKFC